MGDASRTRRRGGIWLALAVILPAGAIPSDLHLTLRGGHAGAAASRPALATGPPAAAWSGHADLAAVAARSPKSLPDPPVPERRRRPSPTPTPE